MSRLQRSASRTTLAMVAALGLVTALQPFTASADDAAARTCVSAGNVWVVVDRDGTVKGGCATKFSTGLEALASAGFTVVAPGGFVSTINGQPNPAGAEDWWSYWHNTPGDDGVYAGWKSYQVGASTSAPKAGSVEGWRLWHSYSEDAQAPTVNPVADFVLGEPTPTPSPTLTDTPTATPSATTSATATATSSATATATASPSAPTAPGLPHSGN